MEQLINRRFVLQATGSLLLTHAGHSWHPDPGARVQCGRAVVLMGLGGCGMNLLLQAASQIPTAVNRRKLMMVNENEHLGRLDSRWPAAIERPERIASSRGHFSSSVRSDVMATLSNSSGLAILAGLGGSTGTRASLAVISMAEKLYLPWTASFVLPFEWEKTRRRIALASLNQFAGNRGKASLTDLDNLAESVTWDTSIHDCFYLADTVAVMRLRQALITIETKTTDSTEIS